MLKHVHAHWRIVASLTLALVLILTAATATLAATRSSPFTHPATHHKAGKFYLALGDSLAFGYQPNLHWRHGYTDILGNSLVQKFGFEEVANMACNGETSITMLSGACPYKTIRKYQYKGSQLEAALDYINARKGQVKVITLDMGANDLTGDENYTTCTLNQPKFMADLARVDINLSKVILPRLYNALLLNGQLTGQIVMMNYYDPFQNICPNSVTETNLVNQHLAIDVARFGTIVNVFDAFGGVTTPNPHICHLTWMCNNGSTPDIHATDKGYDVIADLFQAAIKPVFV